MNGRVRQSTCLTSALGGLTLAALGFLWVAAPAAAAIHYPPGAVCYDCHSVSRETKIAGTRLIKASVVTENLGITTTTPAIKCLYCHRTGAVSVSSSVMRPVWDHFNAQSMSKHPASELSGFGAGAGFDCRDCHTAFVDQPVTADGSGNATIHGRDALTTNLPVWQTLIGSFSAPYTDATLSAQTCGNAFNRRSS